jgi:hypothetical protein
MTLGAWDAFSWPAMSEPLRLSYALQNRPGVCAIPQNDHNLASPRAKGGRVLIFGRHPFGVDPTT